MKNWAFWIYFAIIFAVGLVLRAVPLVLPGEPTHSAQELLRETVVGLGEALVIAALLALFVDRYAKLRLATDVGEDIASKVHGYHLPDELREELNSINNFTFILRNFLWDIDLRPGPSGDGAYLWHWVLSYDVENITYDDQQFTQTAACSANLRNNENLDSVKIVTVKHCVNDKKVYRYGSGDAEFDAGFSAEGSMKRWTSTRPVTIPARNFESKSRAKYTFYSVVEKIVTESEVQDLSLKYTSIGLRVKVTAPPEIDIVISLENAGVQRESFGHPNTYEWISDRVFLRKQGLWIKHERKPLAPIAVAVNSHVVPRTLMHTVDWVVHSFAPAAWHIIIPHGRPVPRNGSSAPPRAPEEMHR